jgi:hypothetical protein
MRDSIRERSLSEEYSVPLVSNELTKNKSANNPRSSSITISDFSPVEKSAPISKSPINLEELYQYFEKNPEELARELEQKNIYFQNNRLFIKKVCILDYIKTYQEFNHSEKKDDSENQEQKYALVVKSCLDTLQNLIDEGELIQAFFIYHVFRNRLAVSNNVLKLWTQASIGMN